MSGNDATKIRLTRFVRQINRPVGKNHQAYLGRRLDVGLYLKWLAGAVLTGNYDGFDQNYALYEHTASGKYRIIPWDYEGTWGRNCYGRLCGSDLVEVKGYNMLTRKVLAYKSSRRAYRLILTNLLANRFTWKSIEPVILDLYKKLTPAIQDDFTRKWPFHTFQEEPEVFKNYVKERRSIIKEELRKVDPLAAYKKKQLTPSFDGSQVSSLLSDIIKKYPYLNIFHRYLAQCTAHARLFQCGGPAAKPPIRPLQRKDQAANLLIWQADASYPAHSHRKPEQFDRIRKCSDSRDEPWTCSDKLMRSRLTAR